MGLPGSRCEPRNVFSVYSGTSRLSIGTYDPLLKTEGLDLGTDKKDCEIALDFLQNRGLRDQAPPLQLPLSRLRNLGSRPTGGETVIPSVQS
jgi:hypothetical protein